MHFSTFLFVVKTKIFKLKWDLNVHPKISQKWYFENASAKKTKWGERIRNDDLSRWKLKLKFRTRKEKINPFLGH